MLGYNRRQLFKGLAAAVGTVSIFAPLDLFHSFTTVESYNGDGFQRFFFRILRPQISGNIRALSR